VELIRGHRKNKKTKQSPRYFSFALFQVGSYELNAPSTFQIFIIITNEYYLVWAYVIYAIIRQA
jgi:hypothetical protein